VSDAPSTRRPRRRVRLFEGFTRGGEFTPRAVSRYGYGYPTSERTHFEFLQVVLVRCCKMRSSFAGEHGDDPAESLLCLRR
jgi:hypothetical protein